MRGIPNVVLFKDGKPVDNFVGALPESQIRAFLARHVQKPDEQQLAVAREAMQEKRYGVAAEALSVVLAINPANQQARADYVTALTRLGRFDQARTAFEPLAGAAHGGPAARGRRPAARCLRSRGVGRRRGRGCVQPCTRRPKTTSAALRLAQWLMAQSRWAEAMDELLVIAARDRRFGDDIARRTILAIFELCPEPGAGLDLQTKTQREPILTGFQGA